MKIQSILLGLIAVFTLTLTGCASYQKMLGVNQATDEAADDPSLRQKIIVTSGDYSYYVGTKYNNHPSFAGKAIISDYVGSEKDIVIPSEIDGYSVAVIAGIDNKMLNSVTVPKSVELIREAFKNCQLSSIIISEDGLPLNISWAFDKNQLTKLTIPARVKEIFQSFDENPINSITFGGSDLKIQLPFKNNLLFYSYLFSNKPGTYEQRGNLVYLNGQTTVAPAFLMGGLGVFIENVDQDAKIVNGGWLIRQGSHLVVARREVMNSMGKSISRAQLTINFQAGKRYMLMATDATQTSVSFYIEEMSM